MKTRDRFVVIWFAFLYLITWGLSLANLFGIRFWDKNYALSKMEEPSEGIDLAFKDSSKTYFSDLRYLWFLPHVLGAIFWWNLYFLQLIPKIRNNHKAFHRRLGRFLMVILLIQNISGVGLAVTSRSNIIKLVSYILVIASCFCIFKAWRYAYWRDIPRHKYWVIRLVGYMQTIALQRFWGLILIVSYRLGWYGMYPQLDDDATDEEWAHLVGKIFDDSFILCILTAILTTEWYLAAEQGMTETPINNRNKQPEDPMQKEADELKHSFNGSTNGEPVSEEEENDENDDLTSNEAT